MSTVVRMQGITKRFGRIIACDRVDLEVREGTIHAIVGENGAGKTTLMSVLYGLHRPDAGSLEVHGKGVIFHKPIDAIRCGIGMVSQHYSIIPELSSLDNLMLGAESSRFGVLRRREAAQKAQRLAKHMGFSFDWYAPAETLTPAGRQKLEIMKLLWRDATILILDEPTAMLPPQDSQALFQSLAQLVREGRTVLLVTHRLREVMDYCDRVTVLRAGRKVGECNVADTDVMRLSEWIVGHDVSIQPRLEVSSVRGETVLQVRGLSVLGNRGNLAVNGLSLSLRAGELAGIAGVDGNGQTELVEALAGIRTPEAGEVRLFGEEVTSLSATARIARGLRYVPPDRHQHGFVENWSVLDNAILGLQRLPPICNGPLISRRAQHRSATTQVEMFDAKIGSLRSLVSELSGGNQQKLMVARSLHLEPKVLVGFQPTRGLDVRTTKAVYERIRARCTSGMAALVVSFDLDELTEQCDPIFVMREGRLVAELRGNQIQLERIGRLMVGAEVA